MSTGDIKLDILLNKIKEDAISNSQQAIDDILHRYPQLTHKEAEEIHTMLIANVSNPTTSAELVVTTPASFAVKTKNTKVVVKSMIEAANFSILITGYALSEYFDDIVDIIIRKSKSGVMVKFYANNADNQDDFKDLIRNRSKFLRLYNYPKQNDKMSALHAKVLSIDGKETLITSANLSYHGQEGNIEIGTRIYSVDIAKQIDQLFTTLLFEKVFEEI